MRRGVWVCDGSDLSLQQKLAVRRIAMFEDCPLPEARIAPRTRRRRWIYEGA